MPKLKTETYHKNNGLENELKFSYDIYVTVDGRFTTTLPEKAVELLRKAGIKLSANRAGKFGFLESASMAGLMKDVNNLADDYFSKEQIEDVLVIRYAMQTTCSYVFDEHGNICPNGSYSPLGGGGWRNGTIELSAGRCSPYGLLVYCEPLHRVRYLYKSGHIKTEYRPVRLHELQENQEALKWLSGLCTISPNGIGPVHEIPYDELAASFFVRLIKSICAINENIKDFIGPESIQKLIEKNAPFLGIE